MNLVDYAISPVTTGSEPGATVAYLVCENWREHSRMIKTSCLYKEVHELPLVLSIGDWYTSTKKSSPVLSTGLAAVEGSISSVWERIFMGSKLADRVDDLAGDGISKLKERFPIMHSSTEELKDLTSQTLKTSIRAAMKTVPGKMVLAGLDRTLDSAERFLKRIRPRDASPRKRKITRAAAQALEENVYASEDSGACAGTAHKSQQTLPMGRSTKSGELTLLQKAYRLGFVFPVEVLVQVLKSLRRYIGGKRSKYSVRTKLSPEKEKEIDSRRKVSPRKKVKTTLLGRIAERTYRLLGYKHVRALDLRNAEAGESPERGEAGKRKHDEIETDEWSEEEDDMDNFDFDNYDSEDDPDYEPDSKEEEETSDSEDSGEAESDLEPEVASKTTEKEFLQLKDKVTDARQNEAKVLPNKGPEIVSCAYKDAVASLKVGTDKKDAILKKDPVAENKSATTDNKDAILKKSPVKITPGDVALKPQWQKS